VSTEVRLRAPAPADVDALLDLVAACDETWREWTPPEWQPPDPGSARWVSELGASDRWTRVAVDGADEGRIVGFVSFGPARAGPEWRVVPGTAHLSALFVHPDCWRHGIATLLLAAAVGVMRAQGYRRAQLNTAKGAPAERFYVRAGWERTGGERWHAAMGLPSVCYIREL
jgi:GNAT superfamily N-acetyltransferase